MEKNFKFMVLRLLENALATQKELSSPLGQREITNPLYNSIFQKSIPQAERQEETMRTTQNDIKCRFNQLQPKVILHGSENCPVKEDRCTMLDQNRYDFYVEKGCN